VSISLDCPDPQRLADFYLGLLGGHQLWAKRTSVGVEVPGAVLVALAEQRDPRWTVLLDPAGRPFCLTPITPEPLD
jgi:hypothetical protein